MSETISYDLLVDDALVPIQNLYVGAYYDGPYIPEFEYVQFNGSPTIATSLGGDQTQITIEEFKGTTEVGSATFSRGPFYGSTGYLPLTTTPGTYQITSYGFFMGEFDAYTAYAYLTQIGGTQLGQPTSDHAAIQPFVGVTLTDQPSPEGYGPDLDTLTITPSTVANGVLVDPNQATDGGRFIAGGAYVLTGSAAAVSNAVAGLVFVPVTHQTAPGQSVTTTFSLTDSNSYDYGTSTELASVTVTASDDPAVHDVTGPRAGLGVLMGTNGPDLITAYGLGNLIIAPGSDTVIVAGAGGAIVMASGGGDDIILGGSLNLVNSGAGGDTISGAPGGYTSVTLGAGNDVIDLGGNSNVVSLGAGNQIVQLAGADNDVRLGNGNSTVYLEGGSSSVVLGSGDSTVALSGASNSVRGGNGQIAVSGAYGGLTTVRLGNGDDRVSLGGDGNTVKLGTGTDSVYFYGRSNVVTLGNGNNSVYFASDNSTVLAGSGDNSIDVLGVNESIRTGNGNNNIEASGGGSTITTGSGDDTINLGMSGGNLVDAGNGVNTINAPDYGDQNTFVMPKAFHGFDTIAEFSTTDKLDLRPVLSATNWNGSASTLGSYVHITSSYLNPSEEVVGVMISSTAKGAGHPVASLTVFNPTSPMTFASLVSGHSLIT